jgi:hypothetical protein
MTALAYVFWHWPRPEKERAEYEGRLLGFHRALQAKPPAGLLYSGVFRVQGAPWIDVPGAVYEDWYLLAGSAALDVLNDAALAPPLGASHDHLAAWAAGGTAGLYRLRSGSPGLRAARSATWLSKPAGASHAEWHQMAARWTGSPDVGLWGRQMVLGPTPEYCLLAPAEIRLPAALAPVVLALEPVWTGDR